MSSNLRPYVISEAVQRLPWPQSFWKCKSSVTLSRRLRGHYPLVFTLSPPACHWQNKTASIPFVCFWGTLNSHTADIIYGWSQSQRDSWTLPELPVFERESWIEQCNCLRKINATKGNGVNDHPRWASQIRLPHFGLISFVKWTEWQFVPHGLVNFVKRYFCAKCVCRWISKPDGINRHCWWSSLMLGVLPSRPMFLVTLRRG